MLATCLGSELLAEAAGGRPERLSEPQIGWHATELTASGTDDPVMGGLPQEFVGFQWHSYATPLPGGAVGLAQDGAHPDAFRVGEAWGLQFHAEVTEAIVGGWLDRYREDQDAVRIGLDPEPIRAETRERIGTWNGLGTRIAEAFLEHADRLRR
jgi:GMP synthase-like glutamine amidotransferase